MTSATVAALIDSEASVLISDALQIGQTSTAGTVASITLDDLKAGYAVFTAVTAQTGTPFTYSVKKSDKPNDRGVYTYWVALLTGPDNTTDYTYMGILVYDEPSKLWIVKTTKASMIRKDAPSFIVIAWLLRKLSRNLPYDYDKGARVLMSGRCLRCHRPLTVESSINNKYGKKCYDKVYGGM